MLYLNIILKRRLGGRYQSPILKYYMAAVNVSEVKFVSNDYTNRNKTLTTLNLTLIDPNYTWKEKHKILGFEPGKSNIENFIDEI